MWRALLTSWQRAEDRDLGPRAIVARVRLIAGIVLDDHDLLDVAGDHRSLLRHLARDDHAHHIRNTSGRRCRVAWVGRPGETAVRRRQTEDVVLEAGESLHRVRWCTVAHEVDVRPLAAPPGHVIAWTRF